MEGRINSKPVNDWYKDIYFWRKKSKDGSDGKGDLIFNTCYKIFQDQDKSDWAYCALDACYLLLYDGVRWPNRMNSDDDAESRIERFIHRVINNLLNKQILPFRYQRRMTRDPFIAFYHLAVYLGAFECLNLKMPWYLYSVKTWRWHKRLIKDSRKDFVVRLDYIRSSAVVQVYEAKNT